MRPLHAFLGILALALLGTAGWLYMNSGDVLVETTTITERETIDETVLGFVAVPYIDDYGNLRVPGYLDNLSGSDIRSARLEIDLLDDTGDLGETVLHTLENVPAGSRKTFDINAGTIGESRRAEIEVLEIEVVR